MLSHQELQNEPITRFDQFIKILNFLKKPIDIIDDAWNGMRGLLPARIVELIGPLLVGSVSFFINLLEGYNAQKEFREAYRNEEIGQRKTRLLTSFLSFGLAGAGAGLGATLLIGGLGEMGVLAVEIGSMGLLPFLIPTLLFAMYSLALWKNSYVLHRAKEIEQTAKEEYQRCIQQSKHPTVKAERLFQAYQNAYQNRLQAEKEVALHTIEVAGSALICIGIALGSAALVGASVASFGAVPLALLITGVVLGFASKLYEFFDDKKHEQGLPTYSERLRNFFRNIFDLPDDKPQFNNQYKLSLIRHERCFTPCDNPFEEEEKNYRYKMWSEPPVEVGLKPTSKSKLPVDLKPSEHPAEIKLEPVLWSKPPIGVGLKPDPERSPSLTR